MTRGKRYGLRNSTTRLESATSLLTLRISKNKYKYQKYLEKAINIRNNLYTRGYWICSKLKKSSLFKNRNRKLDPSFTQKYQTQKKKKAKARRGNRRGFGVLRPIFLAQGFIFSRMSSETIQRLVWFVLFILLNFLVFSCNFF